MSKRTIIDKAGDEALQWLQAVERELDARHPASLAALRAALHVLRDSLGKQDAVDFGNSLPMLIRGIYYEGWTPSRGSKNDVLQKAARDLRSHSERARTEEVLRSCFRAFARCLAPERAEIVSEMLAKNVRPLWPEPPAAPAPRHLQDWHWR